MTVTSKKSFSVVIPTFNGRHLLEKNLPPLLAAIKSSSEPVEVIVVDDASGDGTSEMLKRDFQWVVLIENRVNSGFAETMNRGIAAAGNDILLALNNDILVEDDLFAGVCEKFNDAQLFSVTPDMIDPRRRQSQAIPRVEPGICWFGTRYLQKSELSSLEGEIPVFYGSGGASFYDREKLVFLKGFDTIYQPFYIEDIDLSYRAWKCGWKSLFMPEKTVYHETSSTILALHKKRKIKFIGDRNRTLFLWLNITDTVLILRYFLFLPFSMLYDIVAIRKYKFVGFFRALAILPKLPALRRERKGYFKVSDSDILKLISHKVPR